MKKRGMLTMVLASAMAVSTLAAVPAAADETAASSLDIYGGLTPMEDADDPITYTIFVRDPGVAPSEDNPVIKKIQELTGVTLKFEYLVGDRLSDTRRWSHVQHGNLRNHEERCDKESTCI